jgi:tripartite-type tricarboxylate transporter receptor subunit TctC
MGLMAAALALPGAAKAASYPDKPVTVIVPFPPGGPTDIIARIVAEQLSKEFGQQFVIDNRPGAAGNIGIAATARMKPDGYTLMVVSSGMAVSQAVYSNLAYDPIKDFDPISILVAQPSSVVVRTESPIKSIAELVAAAKAKPGALNYSSPGVGTKSHLAGERLKLVTGADIVHIPYAGSGPATQALLEGTADVGFLGLASVEPLVKAGKFRALGVTGATRWFTLPDVPTMVESGFPGFVSESTQSVFAPAGTPPEVIDAVSKKIAAIFQKPDVRAIAEKAGFQIVASTPEQLKTHLAADIVEIKDTVKKAGLKID